MNNCNGMLNVRHCSLMKPLSKYIVIFVDFCNICLGLGKSPKISQ